MKVALALLALAFVVSMFSMADAGSYRYKCRGRKCCRQRIDYGTCYKQVRRWAYNITCGQCVPFEYSGCGGDDNNFSCLEDCQSCCRGCGPCPRFTLPKPPPGCEYRWSDDHEGCPRPKLECRCPKTSCRPDACSIGQRCVPCAEPCNRCPCPQYKCITDPCYAISKQLRPCETCAAVPAPTCNQAPCPLIAVRENKCGYPPAPQYPPPQHPPQYPPPQHPPQYPPPQPPPQYPPPQPPQVCAIVVPCPPTGNPCQTRSCPAYPEARCVVDPCDCRKCSWVLSGITYTDSDCYSGYGYNGYQGKR